MTDGKNTLHASPKSARPERAPSDWSRPEAQQVGTVSPEESKLIRARQDSRSRMLGVILLAMCVLFFAITLVKIGAS